MKPPIQHPSLLLGRYRTYLAWFGCTAVIQMLWAMGVLYLSTARPDVIPFGEHRTFQPGIVYAAYSGMQAFFIGAATGLAWFLTSRGWLRAAAFASSLPGLGIAFGILQVLPGFLIYRQLARPEWAQFFGWHERRHRGNGLTS